MQTGVTEDWGKKPLQSNANSAVYSSLVANYVQIIHY